jgi:glycosyltransferase involved in cell wall biosynthesis
VKNRLPEAKPSSNPSVNIGLPVFNGQEKVERALDSILNQTYRNIQVLISDNASTDNTQAICERICAEDERVFYVRQPVNLGPTANFNAVLDLARGDYFMWLGHDDWLSERFVEVCVKTLDENPDISLACGEAVYYQDGDESHRGVVVQLPQESPQERVTAYYSLVAENGTFYGLMRREQLANREIGNIMGGDWLVVASMAFLGKVVTLPSVSVHRELGGSTVSYTKIANTLGVSKFQAVFPHAVTAFSAFREIAWHDPIYSLKRTDRVRLAWKCQRIIRSRFDASLLSILQRGLRLGRHSIKKRLIGSATS